MQNTIISIETAEDFKQKILLEDKIVLVDFWAKWCGPCKALEPTLLAVAAEYAEEVVFCKVDIDAHEGLAVRYGIRGVPYLALFKNGEIVGSLVGVQPKPKIIELLTTFL